MRRRDFVKATGALTSLSMIGTVGATKNREHGVPLDKHNQIRERVWEAFKASGYDGVKKVLDKEEMTYELGKATLGEPDEGPVSPQYKFDKDDSQLLCNVYPMAAEDRIFVQALMKLRTMSSGGYRDAAFLNDVIGITYNDDHWSKVGQPTKYGSGVNGVEWYSQSVEDGGLAAEVDIPEGPSWSMMEETNVYLETQLENLDGVAGQVWASYDHTNAVRGGIGNIVSVSGGVGPLEVDLGFSAGKYWDLYKASGTDDALNPD